MSKNRIRYEKDFVLNNGNIGIGTTNPTSTLEVLGDVSVTSAGATSGSKIKAKHYTANGGSLALETNNDVLFSVINVDTENPNAIYVINDANGLNALSVSNSGITSVRQVNTPIVNFSASGAASSTTINAKHYSTQGGYLAFESGINTSPRLLISSATPTTGEIYSINNNDARPILSVFDSGETALVRASFAATTVGVGTSSIVGAASTQKMQISAVSRDNGLLEIANYGGNQLFSVSNNQTEDTFAINRYGNFANISPVATFENKKLFGVNSLGIVTTYGGLRVGSSHTTANSSVFSEFYGNVDIKAPFSTTTEYVSIVPKFRDRGALSFESPIGTAQTDRGTQVFSISNNLSGSIFRVNSLTRQPLLEVNASGVGLGTTNPSVRLEVVGSTRVTSSGSTAGEQIDIRHYRNIADQSRNYTGIGLTNNRGAISFDSPTGFSTNGIQLLPASLFAITNDPTGNIFSVSGYGAFSSSVGVPAIDVTQSGRVGIGTTNPQEKLHIVGNAQITGNVQITGGITTITTSLDVSSVLRVTSIGSTTAEEQIEIKHITPTSIPNSPTRGSVLFEGVLEPIPFDGGQLVTILNDNSTLFGVSRILGITSTNPPPVGTRLIEPVLDISSSGNIGIGATNVSNKVQLNPINELIPSVVSSASSIGISTTIIGINTSGIAIGLEIQSFAGVIAAGTTVVSIGNAEIGIGRTTLNNFIRTNTVLTFGSRGNDRVVAITSAGFVGLGITNPTVKLDVAGNVRISGVSTVGLGSTSSPTVNSTMSFELTNNTTLTVRVRGTDGTVRTGIITLS